MAEGSCFDPITIKSVKNLVTTYPYQDKGKLETEDQEIKKIFEISKYTLRLCSNEFIMAPPGGNRVNGWEMYQQYLQAVFTVVLVISN